MLAFSIVIGSESAAPITILNLLEGGLLLFRGGDRPRRKWVVIPGFLLTYKVMHSHAKSHFLAGHTKSYKKSYISGCSYKKLYILKLHAWYNSETWKKIACTLRMIFMLPWKFFWLCTYCCVFISIHSYKLMIV